MANTLVYNGVSISDDVILSGSVHLENSMVSETLGADTLVFVAIDKTGQPIPLRSLTDDLYSLTDQLITGTETGANLPAAEYGDPIEYWRDGELFGKFYIRTVQRIARDQYRVECISAIGLLINVTFYGGVYTVKPASDLIDEIMATIGYTNGTDYTIDADVGAQPISGWLGISSSRDALQQVMFAVGASVLKASDGSLRFSYNEGAVPIVMDSSHVYMGGSIGYLEPATSVVVTEHGFYQTALDEEVELYNDNVEATNKVVYFKEPCHSFRVTGTITYTAYDNYAIVSGAGSLIGKKYTHTTKELTYAVPNTNTAPHVVTVSEATLVNSSNSYYVAKRVANYYGAAKDVKIGLVIDEPTHTGDLIQFTDPFDEERVGLIKTMDITMSKILKSNTVVSTNFQRGPYGNNFVDYLIIHSGATDLAHHLVGLNGLTGTFDPADYGLDGERCRVVAFSGAKGGQCGTDGQGSLRQVDIPNRIFEYAAGKGGKKGLPGTGLYFHAADMVLEDAVSVVLGKGGEGSACVAYGATQPEGADGDASTFDTLDSTTGGIYTETGYENILTGEIYGGPGLEGYDGGDGDEADHKTSAYVLHFGGLVEGQMLYVHVFYGGQNNSTVLSWKGGKNGAFRDGRDGLYTANDQPTRWYSTLSVWGAGGSGPAYGADGLDGSPLDASDPNSPGGTEPGVDGADVTGWDLSKPSFGKGGTAGCGGGGGGCQGGAFYSDTFSGSQGTASSGGHGTDGGDGSDGFILILSPVMIS